MQASQHTVQLVWGLFDDICCSGKPLATHTHNSSSCTIQGGWNTPGSRLFHCPTSSVQQISLGWAQALLLTEHGEAYAALASQVLQHARSNKCSSALQLPSATTASPGSSSSSSSSSSSIWQPVQLLSSTTCHDLSAPVLIKQVSAGDQHCLLLDHSGCVWAMGSNQHGQLGLSPQQAVAAAAAAAVASEVLPASEAGAGTTECQQGRQVSCQPKFVAVLGPSSASSMQQPVQQVAAGACHSIAVTASLGRLYAWGWNAHGQCGTGSTADVQQPTLCTALDGVPLRCAAAGMAHSVAASRDGAVYAWGWGSDGQLGLSEATAAANEDEGAAAALCCSAAESGRVSGGSGTAQQQQQQRSSLLPVLVEGAELDEEDVVQVACGSRHTVVLTASGRVFAWGLNKHGQCCTAAASEAVNGATAAAAAAAAAVTGTTAAIFSPASSFEAQTVAAPTAVSITNTLLLRCNVQEEVAAMAGVADVPPGSDGARKLVECNKAVAVRAGRWHTAIELVTS